MGPGQSSVTNECVDTAHRAAHPPSGRTGRRSLPPFALTAPGGERGSPVGFGYHYHNVLREGETPELARRHAHARALQESASARSDDGRWRSLRDSVMALLRWRPASRQPAAFRDAVTGRRIEAHDLTDHVCRLADGSMGRVAIIAGKNEEWTALCVRV